MRRTNGILLAAVLVGVGLGVPAASGQRQTAEGALTAGRAAMEDGFYALALRQFAVYTNLAAAADARAAGRVWVARALLGLKRHDEALKLLEEAGPDVPADETTFWRAAVHFEQAAFARALDVLDGFDRRFRKSPYEAAALRLQARAALMLGRRDEAAERMRLYDRRFPKGPDAAENLLDLATTLHALGQDDAAADALDRLTQNDPGRPEAHEAMLWRGRLLAQAGAIDRARALLEQWGTDTNTPAAYAARGWWEMAQWREAETNAAAAMADYARCARVSPDPDLARRARMAMGLLQLRGGDVTGGVDVVRASIAEAPLSPDSGQAQLDLAQALLDRALPEQAEREFQYYLDVFTNRLGRANAELGRGAALVAAGRLSEAAVAYEKAARLLDDPVRRFEALHACGDAYAANNQFGLAAERFSEAAAGIVDPAAAARARLQAARNLRRVERFEEAHAALDALEGPQAASVEAQMERARLLEAQGRWTDALTVYRGLADRETSDTVRATARLAGGLLAFRQGAYDEALEDFAEVLSILPEGPAARQAEAMRAWSLYRAGREDEALKAAQTLIDERAASPWAADTLFWMGEYHFNHGRYAEAETRFAEVAERFPEAVMADDALYWAGRAAVARKEYLRAIEYFSELVRLYPESALMPDVRFAQGDTLAELGRFDEAILAFEEIVVHHPSSPLLAAAWGRKGDCQFTLAGAEPSRYADARASFERVGERADVPTDLRLQAWYKAGRCMQEAGDNEAAFEQFLRVVYAFLDPANADGEGALWFTRAAFDAAAIKEAQRAPREAARIYRRVAESGLPAAEEAQKRLRAMRVPALSIDESGVQPGKE